MKKLLSYKPSQKLIAVTLLAVLFISMLPVLKLSSYAIPWYDDYGYTKYTISFREAYGDSFFNALKGAWHQTVESWWAWQGTYATTFISAMSPLAWGAEYYPLGACFLVIVSTLSPLALLFVLSKYVFGMSHYGSLSLAAAGTILITQKCAYPGHAFFWFNGGVHYAGMSAFFMLYVACVIYFLEKKNHVCGTLQIVITTLLALTVAGGNFVTLLQGAMILPFLLVFVFSKYKKRAWRVLPSAAVYLTGFYMNVSAPGNNVRASAYTAIAVGPARAVYLALRTAAQKILPYTDIFLIVCMILLIPVIWKALDNSVFSFRYPFLFVLLALGIYAAGYTPPIYAMGAAEVPRILNACKISWHLALLLSEIWLIGWIKKKKSGELKILCGSLWQILLGAVIIAVFFLAGDRNIYSYTTGGAMYELLSGEADAFKAEYDARIAAIEKGGDVRVSPYAHMTFYLTQGDLSADPAADENRTMADWYGADSIALE